jgi:MinD superfamily P-loop ATPase
MKIAFASGKGGTGKTTVAANFVYLLASSRQQVQYLDCDVEEPNGHIFLKPTIHERHPAKVMTPVIDHDKCTSCGECSAKCQFNALVTLPGNTLVFPELCHGCGLCVRICPEGAISEDKREIGFIEKGKTIDDVDFVSGTLNVGEPMAGPLIQEVKRRYTGGRIQIIDAPPGTSCPVVKTVTDVDCVVMVTEPTPFGLHDLKIAVTVAEMLGKPIGVVINRENGGFPPLTDYLSEKGLPVLMTLPENRDISVSYSMGNLILRSLPAYREQFIDLAINIGRLSGTTLWRDETWRR